MDLHYSVLMTDCHDFYFVNLCNTGDNAGLAHAGSRVGAVMRALASHQCVPGSIPRPGVICGLSLLLVLTLLRGFFSGFSGFPPSTKINISKFQFNLETVDEEPPRGNATANSIRVRENTFVWHILNVKSK